MKPTIPGLLFILIATSGWAGSAQDPVALGKTLVAQLAARQFEKVEVQFTETVQSALPAEKLAKVWDSLVSQAGAFQSIEGTRVVHQQGVEVVIVTCAFARASLDAQIAFDSQARVAGLYFRPAAAHASNWTAPTYANPHAFQERARTVLDGKFELPATLTIPTGKGPFPAVVLVQGSGPQDQDETIGPNKPFKDLAWGLASRGIAVLRYVKRTMQYGPASATRRDFTVDDETVDDARAAVTLLRSLPDIDGKRVYVLGHSLGGMLAPRIAQHDSGIAGLVILAGSTRPLEDSVVAQLQYLASLEKSPSPAIESQIAAAKQAAVEIESPALRSDSTVMLPGGSVPGSYFLDLRSYHPGAVAATLALPMLILQGGRDYQVTQLDFDGWKRALSDHRNVTFHFYPGLTHLFMTGAASAPPSPADYEVPGHVAAAVIEDIAQWIASRGKG